MHIIEALLFGLALIIDSFTISTTFGLVEQKETLVKDMNIIGITCAVGQISFLIFGWTIGKLISEIVLGLSKWIGFILLCSLSVYMVVDAFGRENREFQAKRFDFNLKILLYLVISTSFDVISVGIVLGLIHETIMLLIIFTGIFTYISAHGGGNLGYRIGETIGAKKGQILGAVLLFVLACTFL